MVQYEHNCHKKEPKTLQNTSVQPNRGGKPWPHPKNALMKLSSWKQSIYLISFFQKVSFLDFIKILIFVLILTNIRKNLHKYLKLYHNFKLRGWLGSTENNTNDSRFKGNSNCLPNKLPSSVETFITAVNHDIKSSKTKEIAHDSVTKSEWEAFLNQ